MSLVLEKEIEGLKRCILSLGGIVEEQVHLAVKSLINRDEAIADAVIKKDEDIDRAEVEMEEACLKLLALHQPVAIDLRFIITVLKINSELERIGNLAVNICERAQYLARHPQLDTFFDFSKMSSIVKDMLKRSLDSLVNLDAKHAFFVCEMDNQIDEINRQMYESIQDGIRKQTDRLDCYIHTLSVSRHLERIADLATNIAEDVIYMVEGEIVRHQVEEYVASDKNKLE